MKNHIFIEIPRRSSACMAGKEPFVEGMDYYSVLSDSTESSDAMVRKDYCKECWDTLSRSGAQSYWKGKIPSKKAEVRENTDLSAWALELLKVALEKEDDANQSEAFILALYLARKRQLVLRRELIRGEGNVFFVYEVPLTEEMFVVKKMDLSKLQTEKIQFELAQKLRIS